MRWILFALSAWTMLATSTTVSHAEDDPRVERILDHWKKLPEDLQSCRLSGRRFVYDAVFQVERRAEFEIGWEKDGRAILRFMPINIPDGDRSQKLTRRGKSYSLRSDLEETWYLSNQQELIQAVNNGAETIARRYEIKSLARAKQSNALGFIESIGWGFYVWAMPLLVEFPIHPALTDIPSELNWKLIKEKHDYYWLSGSPSSEKSPHARNFSEIKLIVNKLNLSILAMTILDPAGTKETVYRFDERDIKPVFTPDAEIFDIHEEELEFVEPLQSKPKTAH